MCEQYGIDTIARKVIQYDPAAGCSGLSLSSLNEVGEFTCDEAGRSHVSLLEELYDGDTHLRCFAVAETIADVCGTYTEVPHAETRSLTDLLAMACGRDNIRTVRDARLLTLEIADQVEAELPALISTDSVAAFRAVRARADIHGETIRLTAETAAALKVRNGATIRVKS